MININKPLLVLIVGTQIAISVSAASYNIPMRIGDNPLSGNDIPLQAPHRVTHSGDLLTADSQQLLLSLIGRYYAYMNPDDCSYFAKEAAGALQVRLGRYRGPGKENANTLYTWLTKNWKEITFSEAFMRVNNIKPNASSDGWLFDDRIIYVVAPGVPHGHIALLVPGPGRYGFPNVAGGALHTSSRAPGTLANGTPVLRRGYTANGKPTAYSEGTLTVRDIFKGADLSKVKYFVPTRKNIDYYNGNKDGPGTWTGSYEINE